MTAHCDAAGGATFAPLAAALRAFLPDRGRGQPTDVQATIEAAIPVTDAERSRIAGGIAALLAGSPPRPRRPSSSSAVCSLDSPPTKPVMLVIDDLHWAEPLLLDLVEHLVQWGSGMPLFVLVGARPELRDLRSSMVTPGGLVSEVVTLAGLDAGAAMRLAANVIGAADLPAAVAAKVLATSEGNPLFVGELVRMLVDEGAIERQGERWIVGANLAALEMPPTIHALLAARIERLGPEDRTVLERAAVVGRHFSRSAVAALLGRNGSELNARLEALQRTELIERDTGWFLGEPVLRFHHVLIRDAAYRRLLKGTRAELHEQLADWIEAQVEGRRPSTTRRSAGTSSRRTSTGASWGRSTRGARRSASAPRPGLRLPAGGHWHATTCRWRPVCWVAPSNASTPDDPARAGLALDWCEALLAGGDVGTAETAIQELGRFIGHEGPGRDRRLAAWHTCFAGQLTVLTAPEALHVTADAVAAAAEELASLDDAAGEAKAHFVHALALARLGRIGGCEAALDKALAAARRADDRRRANTVLAIAPLAALWGPSPVTRASGRCLDVVRVLRITQGAPAVEAVALSCQAVLEALRGRTDAARRMLASSRKMVEDLGITHRLLETDVFGGLIDLLEGDAVAAEQNLRRAYDGLRDLGLGIDAARAAALLGARAAGAGPGRRGGIAVARERGAGGRRSEGRDRVARRARRGAGAARRADRGRRPRKHSSRDRGGHRRAARSRRRAPRAGCGAACAGRGREADAEERRAIALWEAKGAMLLADGARRRGTTEPENASAGRSHRPTDAPPGPNPAKGGKPSRRVQSNAATTMQARFDSALAARDFDAIRALSARTTRRSITRPGSSTDATRALGSLQRLFRSRDPVYRRGAARDARRRLVLAAKAVRASGVAGGRYDVGAYENEAISLVEVDDRGLMWRHGSLRRRPTRRRHRAPVRTLRRAAARRPRAHSCRRDGPLGRGLCRREPRYRPARGGDGTRLRGDRPPHLRDLVRQRCCRLPRTQSSLAHACLRRWLVARRRAGGATRRPAHAVHPHGHRPPERWPLRARPPPPARRRSRRPGGARRVLRGRRRSRGVGAV